MRIIWQHTTDPSKGIRVALVTLTVASLGLASPSAFAEEIIVRDTEAHPHYGFEAEPHFLVAPFHGGLPGVGFRGTVPVAHDGFISSINDSVGVGFGADWTRDNTWIPVVMQWNFFLSEHWSVFGEPGFAVRLRDNFKNRGPDFTLYGGGRYHFGRNVALTMRVGHPAFAIGLSFLM